MSEIIDFKSSQEFFQDEKSGIKNNTVREIDLCDPRFIILLKAWRERIYPCIRIRISDYDGNDLVDQVNLNNKYSFMRRIQHIAIYKNLMIITWDVYNNGDVCYNAEG